MTVSNLDNKVSYECDGTQTEFGFSFKIFAADDLEVILTNNDAVQIPLVRDIDYRVAPIGDDYSSGGAIETIIVDGQDTLPFAREDGNKITIVRSIDLTQETRYAGVTSFPALMHENALDRLTMISQQISEKVARSLKFNILDAGTDKQLPVAAERALQWLGFDANGDPIAVAGVSGGTPVSTFMGEFLAASSAAAARNYIDVEPLTVATILAALTGSDPQMGLYVQAVDGVPELWFDSNDPDTLPDPVQLTSGGMMNIKLEDLYLPNDTYLKAKNFAGTNYVNIIKVGADNLPQLPDGSRLGTEAHPIAPEHIANKNYVDYKRRTIQTLTADPDPAAVGEIWLRTDL